MAIWKSNQIRYGCRVRKLRDTVFENYMIETGKRVEVKPEVIKENVVVVCNMRKAKI